MKARSRNGDAAARVWALVSGLPTGPRERRRMMVLQAFVDDSGEQDDPVNPAFVLAGFIADSTQWASFSDEWQLALNAKPSIAYFKMVEADRLNGEFDRNLGWTATMRDEKLAILIPIIKKHAQVRVAVSIDKSVYAEYIRSIPVPNRTSIIDKPYFLAFGHMIFGVAAESLLRGINEPCDFIFDEQGSIGNDVLSLWDMLKSNVEQLAKNGLTDFRPFLGSKPIFREEITFKPLQAADFYAWQVRRLYYENNWSLFYGNKILVAPHRQELRSVGQLPAMTWHLGFSEMRKLRLSLLRSAANHSAENPNAELKDYQGPKKRKSARVLLSALPA